MQPKANAGAAKAAPLHIVLVQPEIPQNTGNIARTCAVTGAVLHLVGPLGFSLDDRYLKRAGLDYWELLDIRHYEDLEDFMRQHGQERLRLLTAHAARPYHEVAYQPGDYLVFGRETAGLPHDFIQQHEADSLRIPMIEGARCLNLSNAVAIVTYEALRQLGFPSMAFQGSFEEH